MEYTHVVIFTAYAFFGTIEHHESMVNNKFQLPGMCSYIYIYIDIC